MQLTCRRLNCAVIVVSSLLLAACGTNYSIPRVDSAALTEAFQIIAEERVQAASTGKTPGDEARRRFARVVDSIESVAEEFCQEQRPEEPETFCDFEIKVDSSITREPNAFQWIGGDGRPELSMTPAFLTLARNNDEMAFVLGHEAGHQISGHLEKKHKQMLAGAAIGGLLGTAIIIVGTASGADMYKGGDSILIGSILLGTYSGRRAYSQTYELEADMLGTYIAERAGYDPVLGSRVFARLSSDQGKPVPKNKASFWSTHPRSPRRIATVKATAALIEAQRAKGEDPLPDKRRSLLRK